MRHLQLAALKSLALSVAQARSPDSVLTEVVRGLGMTAGVALARVWLIEKQEQVAAPVLRLRASVGLSLVDPEVRWNRCDGAHARLPVNYGKVGKIASTGKPLLLQRGPTDWLLRPDWAEQEQIESFAGQPLIFRGEVLGVLAIFSRQRLERADLDWLRVFADHAAVAIANARAFKEIATLKERLEQERDYLRDAVRDALHPVSLIAESPSMREVMDTVRAVARSATTVLIHGDTGVGKELIASAIHDLSSRAGHPLVKVNCASVPRELFESEFFGHIKGAFSGATRDREGRFELANGGTLFLDEVGEIPLELQGKLLRVLQEQEFEAVGDDQTKRVDVRLIAATNRNLESQAASGHFRSDLYYRLNVVPIGVPPLRERMEDILPLAERFLSSASKRMGVSVPQLSEADRQALTRYEFPGNIRELRNIIERAVVLHQQGARELRLHLPSPNPSQPRAPEPDAAVADEILSAASFRELEKRNVLAALRRAKWKVSGPQGAAMLLGLSASTFTYRMRALGIERES